MTALIEIETKYKGSCRQCSATIEKGEKAFYDPDGDKKARMICMICGSGDRVDSARTKAEKVAAELTNPTPDSAPKDSVGTPDLVTEGITGDYLSEYRVRLDKVATVEGFEQPYTSAADIEPMCRHMIGDTDREHLIAVAFGPDMKPVGVHTVTVGTLDMTIAQPREAFKFLCVVGAKHFALAHNHPVADCTPSSADFKATARMQDVGKLAGIPLVSSLIIARDGLWCDIMEEERSKQRSEYDWDADPEEGEEGEEGEDGEGPGKDSEEQPEPDKPGEDGEGGEDGESEEEPGEGEELEPGEGGDSYDSYSDEDNPDTPGEGEEGNPGTKEDRAGGEGEELDLSMEDLKDLKKFLQE